MTDTAVILIVEDREDDLFVIQKAFARAYVSNPVQIVRDGAEAIAYLSGEGKYSNRDEYPLPALVLLDLKMPKVDGFEVLLWIRQREGIRGLPVIVLTSSNQMRDVNRAYELGANSFFVKDMDFQHAVRLSNLLNHWLQTASHPEVVRPARKPTAER